jgi:outer membrane protein OmpA-like peptidoglycan-associated protein
MKKHLIWSLVAVAGLASLNTGCETLGSGQKTAAGAGIGAVAGGVLGGVIGASRGNWKEGAAIGAGVGLVAGGLTGAVMDKQTEDMRKAGIASQRDKDGNMIISLAGDALNFETGSAVIGDKGQQTLTNLAGILVKYPENRISIYGFTDNVGSDDANRLLSQQRADAVKMFLLQQSVPTRCVLGAVGYGPLYPVADNSTDAGRAANRRVTLRITVDQDEAKANEAEREKYSNRNNQ